MSIFVEKKKTGLRTELDELARESAGYLSPHRLVEWAKDHPDSALHRHLEWDDEKAAHSWRLAQARAIIRVHVETVAETGAKTRAFVSLEAHRRSDEGYQPLESVLEDPVERRLFYEQARRELKRWSEKYRVLEELRTIHAAIAQQLADEQEGGQAPETEAA